MPELAEYVPAEPKPGRFRRGSNTTKLHGMLLKNNKFTGTWCIGMIFFENDIGVDTVKETITKRVLQFPRFRSSYDFKRKGFVELATDELDLEGYHIKIVDETVSVEDVQRDWIGNVYKYFDFDPSKPLWQFTYFKNLDDGRSLLITNISHVIGDGVSQVEVLFRMMDKDESATEVKAPKRRRKPKGRFGFLNKCYIFVEGVFTAIGSAMATPDSEGPLMRRDPTIASEQKKISIAESISLAKLKEIKNKYHDATLNDIMVALLTLTLHGYLDEVEGGKEFLKKKGRVRSSFLINTRSPKAKTTFRDGSPNNKIALGLLRFPLDVNSPANTVYKVKRQLDRVKLSPTPLVQLSLANNLLKVMNEKSAAELFAAAGNQTTAMLSNVPGPQKTAYIQGHKIQDLQFGLYSSNGLYLGLISYDGKVTVGVTLDEQLGDPKEITKHWNIQFDKLYEETMKHEGMVPKPRRTFGWLDKL
mmetsp:Transcript_8905/g.10180  ORF Transcript_8905/g.10180 Transcript_8905/m.10180 type:complete len:474 (+) Transcript_8905:408-1829(+)